MEKEFKTIEEQIEILKSRKLIIKNEEFAKKIFKENNYYYVINGYKNLFVQEINGEEFYKENVTLEEIYSLYKFDIEIRTNFLKYILSLERRLNTYIAYEFSKNYGHKNYLLAENFDNNKNNSIKIAKLINEIESNKMEQLNLGNRMLNHYMNQYGYVPLWVLIRIMTFGQVSKFYGLMNQKEQNAIAQNFKIREKHLKTYITNLAIIRNICAHDEKLYDIRIRKAISNTDIHKQFNLELKDGTYCGGFKDLFSVVIILKLLLKDEEFYKFYKVLIEDIEKLKKDINSLEPGSILSIMGFPENYQDLITEYKDI